MTRPQLGSVIGSYRLEEQIGEGGMGRVYRARHVQLGRDVALKMLRSEHANNRLALERFSAEARAVNMIAHEHIVQITDLVSDPDMGAYYIMELLHGQPLAALCQRQAPLPLERWVPLAIQICDALVAIHGAGIVHRDLKPDNIFLVSTRGRSGQRDFVKLLDFGIAKFFGADSSAASLPYEKTAEGAVIGTPSYMSPEQATGRDIDHRSDLFSLGIIMFQLATGTLPFAGTNFAELLVSLMTEEPPRPRELARYPMLDELIAACLQKDPSARPESAAEVLEQLREVLARLHTGATELLPALAEPNLIMPVAQRASQDTGQSQSRLWSRPVGGRTDGSSQISLPLGESSEPVFKPSEPLAPAEHSMGHVVARHGGMEPTTTWRARAAVLMLAAMIVVGIGFLANRRQSPTRTASAGPVVMSSIKPGNAVQGIAQGISSSEDHGGVLITFQSSPPDSDVFWINGDMIICRTPCALAVGEPLENHVFEIRREGYEPQRSILTAARDTHIEVALVERGSAPAGDRARATAAHEGSSRRMTGERPRPRSEKARRSTLLQPGQAPDKDSKARERSPHVSPSFDGHGGKPRAPAQRKPLAERLQKDAVLDPFAAE